MLYFNVVDNNVLDDVTETRFKRAGNFGSLLGSAGKCVRECEAAGQHCHCGWYSLGIKCRCCDVKINNKFE